MKEQARELMRQVDVFRVNGMVEVSHVKREGQTSPGARESVKKYASQDTHHATPKPMVDTSSPAAKSVDDTEPVGVVSNNTRRSSNGDEFEEF
jgi:hypothetical protein